MEKQTTDAITPEAVRAFAERLKSHYQGTGLGEYEAAERKATTEAIEALAKLATVLA